MKLVLRPARADDLVALGALKLRSSLAWGDHVEELIALPEARQFPAKHLAYATVAEGDDALVGFATLVPGEGTEAELEDLFVAPEAWRTGVGKRLFAECENRARELGTGSIRVVAGERARDFYEALGFQLVGTVETMFSLAIEMRKSLA